MFTVRQLPPSAEKLQPLLAGVSFGFFDQPIRFEVQAEGAPGPFIVEFVCSRDQSKAAFEVATNRTADDSLRFEFFNPTEGGASGLFAPHLLLTSNAIGLAFIFIVDVVGNGNSRSYRLTYEFGEAPFNETTKKKSGESQ